MFYFILKNKTVKNLKQRVDGEKNLDWKLNFW